MNSFYSSASFSLWFVAEEDKAAAEDDLDEEDRQASRRAAQEELERGPGVRNGADVGGGLDLHLGEERFCGSHRRCKSFFDKDILNIAQGGSSAVRKLETRRWGQLRGPTFCGFLSEKVREVRGSVFGHSTFRYENNTSLK